MLREGLFPHGLRLVGNTQLLGIAVSRACRPGSYTWSTAGNAEVTLKPALPTPFARLGGLSAKNHYTRYASNLLIFQKLGGREEEKSSSTKVSEINVNPTEMLSLFRNASRRRQQSTTHPGPWTKHGIPKNRRWDFEMSAQL
jgi:hypothetical protein